jgi:hypothetical protein
MISPAMLLDRIAHNMHYSPSELYSRTAKPSLTLSPLEWLDQTEKQLVGMDATGRGLSTSVSPTWHPQDSPIK